ncbi:MAG: glycosyltransferase family 9 protein, partial [Candidatus Neomarinimicrobiota bacterium]
ARDTVCHDIERGTPEVINLAGKTSLRESLAVVAGARYVLGSDTGLVHAAGALGVPHGFLLGPTTRQMGAGFAGPGTDVFERAIWCRPCSQNGKRPCYRFDRVCLSRLSPELVIPSLPPGGMA